MAAGLRWKAGHVNTNQHQTPPVQARLGQQLVHAVARSAKALATVVAECHRAQRIMSEYRSQPDRYARYGDRAPETYGEFLYRSSGTVWREPSARERAGAASPHRR
jgi:hypothetical protein